MSTRQYALPPEEPVPGLDGARLLYVTQARYSPEWDSAPHIHACTEMFFVTGGSGSLQLQQDTVPLTAGDLVTVDPGVPHTEHSQADDPLQYVVLGLDGFALRAPAGGYALLHGFAQQRQTALCLEMLLHEAAAGRSGGAALCQSLLRVLLILMTRQYQSILFPVSPEQRSSRECALVRRYIDGHFKEGLTLEQLAAVAHLNKYYLSHAFQKEYGVSPIRYLLRRRIQESRFLLVRTDHSLSHIAQVLGFSSASYFSQCFRRVEGMSPTEYRRRHQAGSTPDLRPRAGQDHFNTGEEAL